MKIRIMAIGLLAAVGGITVAAVAPWRHASLHMHTAGSSHLHAYGVRGSQSPSAQSAKLDSALADIARHLGQVRPDHGVEDLRLVHLGARFSQPTGASEPSVLIDAVTLGDPAQLRASLEALGLQRSAQFKNDVSGWLPISKLQAATARNELHSMRAAMPRRRSGAVTSQGDFAQRSDLVRSANSLDGKGVTVGILSDSYNCYATYATNGVPASGNAGYANNGFTATATDDVTSGDLPSSVAILKEATCLQYNPPLQLPFGDEGRAMMQIVHDVAPGAGLAFYTAENGEADFANGIVALSQAGAKIIADDVGYPDEPFYQDGLIAQAIDSVRANGVTYFSAAGNNGNLAYDNTAPAFGAVQGSGVNIGEQLLNFDTSGATTTTTLPVTIPALIPGEFVVILAEWDQPYVTGAAGSGGATSSIDVCVTNTVGNDNIYDGNLNVLSTKCSGLSGLGQDPWQAIVVGNPANAAGNSSQETLNIVVGLKSGTTVPGRIKVVVEDDGAGSTINAFATNSATLQGHPSAVGGAAVAAAWYYNTPDCGQTPAQIEPFSAEGPALILFDVNGAPLGTPQTRQKPDFVGPDGGNDTFLGFTLESQGVTGGLLNTTIAECQNHPAYPNFFGTSAATPHIAGIAALMLQADPALTPAEVMADLTSSALPMAEGAAFTGAGFVQADAAATMVPAMPPAAPTISVSPTSITLGASATLTWSSANTTGCTASGSWSGAQSSNGSLTVTPSAAATDTYTLVCANAAGNSPASSATLTVNAVASSSGGGHSGGGSLDLLALLGLGALAAWRVRRPA